MNASVNVAATMLGLLLLAPTSRADNSPRPDVFEKTPALKSAAISDVRPQVMAWVESQQVPADVRAQAEALWPAEAPAATGPELLDRLAETFALADARAKSLFELCSAPRQQPIAPVQEWLYDEAISAFVRHNLRLYYGRWLSRERLFDESLAQLEGLQPGDVVDPASLLFYQSVAFHRLLQKEPGVKAIRRLLDDVADSPERYTTVAGLMLADLEALKDESLDHISRRMDDVERRLDLGHAGPKVRKIEDDVITSLDKLIEELEQQQQQQSSASGGGIRSSSPAPDSAILGGKGPGETTQRNVGGESGWGDLPPKQREEALQQIGKDFPAHYRDVIEQYFRKLAGEESEP